MFDKENVQVYNSLTNKLEKFQTIIPGKVSMYICGPTVYNDIHIGNGRPVVFFDVVYRFLKYIGYDVTYVSNFTDIDDKIIKKALLEGVDETVISRRYIDAYLQVCDQLGCIKEVIHPTVTENMEDIIIFIQALIEHDYAYQKGDDVYFRVGKVEKYGLLSNQKIDDLATGSRIDINTNKEDPRDFTLWKKTDDYGLKWDSPFGAGRPGWHTECVVMINKIFGSMVDIHGGGSDLMFPHHENEIAQSLALYNNVIANYWLHNARVDLHDEKMSKSKGNVIWVKDLIRDYSPAVYRLLLLSNHYRQTINFIPETIVQMVGEWEKIVNTFTVLYRFLELRDALNCQIDNSDLMEEYLNNLANDFNTANAFTCIQNHLKSINKNLRNPHTALATLQKDYRTLVDMLDIFGLSVDVKPLSAAEIILIKKWHQARADRDFVLADKLRLQISELGIKL